jgi:integrase/recombinase XerD
MKIPRPLPPFRRRLLADRQIRHSSPHTIDGSLRSVAQCAKHFGPSPDHRGPEPIRTAQLPLLQQQVSTSSCSHTGCALRLFSETPLGRPGMVEDIPAPQQPKTLPVILSRDEGQAFMRAPRHRKHRVLRATLYATGVRVSDLCQLQGPASDAHRLGSRGPPGKGQRERCVLLSPALLPLLRRYGQR